MSSSTTRGNKSSVRRALAGALAFFVLAACGGAGTAPNPVGEADASATVDSRPSDVTVPEAPVDFGLSDCGGGPSTEKAIKITNAGGGTVSWTAELESAGFSILGATGGTFSGGGSANVIVQANPIAATAEAGSEVRATLVIVIDKAKIFRVPLRVAAQGATISVLPGQAVFGELPMNQQAPDLPLTITNTGNKEVAISFDQPAAPFTDFKLDWTGAPAEVKLAPGASVAGAAARFRPSRLVQQNTSAPITVRGAVCGQSAKAVTMTGKGTGGVVGISPGQLDFGKVNCGGKAGFQVFTVLNSGTAPFNWTASLAAGAGSYFDLSPAAGTVLAGSQSQVFVTPKDIPAQSAVTNNLYGDILTITTDAPNDTPHDVNLLMGAKGAILAFTTKPADYGTRVLFSAPLNQTLTLTNSGNLAAAVTLTKATASYTLSVASGTVSGPGTLSSTVGFAPANFGDNVDELKVSTSAVLCQPLPDPIPLTGKGKGQATNVGLGATWVGDGSGDRKLSASTCAVLTPGGHVACWGDNTYGQLGNGTFTSSGVPVTIPSFSGAVQVAGDGSFNCARMTDGSVYCWGHNRTGQLGVSGANRALPVKVGIANVISIGASHRHACAVSAAVAGGTSGKVYCWGYGRRYELGNGVASGYHVGTIVPVEVTGLTDATSVSASAEGGCARKTDGTVWCWGQANTRGQLGRGTTTTNSVGLAGPVLTAAAVNLTGATAVGVGHGLRTRGGGGCALQSTGSVACWGVNRFGQVKQPASTTPDLFALAVTGVSGATAIAVGHQHHCALVAGGAATCWGAGSLGQLGNGASVASSAPVAVSGLPVAGASTTQIAAGGEASCVVLSTGAVMCWGSNDQGQLGNPAAAGTTPSLVFGF